MPTRRSRAKTPEKNLYLRGETWWLRTHIDGVEYRESLRTSDLRNARLRRDKRLEEIVSAAKFGIAKHTWDDTVTAWWAHTKGQIQATTAKRYAVSIKACLPLLKGMDIAKIDAAVISKIMAYRKEKGASLATIRRDLTAISRILEFAEGEGWRDGNPTLSKRRTIKERRDPIVLPEPEEVERMIKACSDRFASLVRAAWYTGCRQGELVKATWRNFNPDAGTLEITGKGNKRRVITLSPRALNLFNGLERGASTNPIFPDKDGKPFAQAASDYTHFRRDLEAKSKKEGTPFRRFRFHDLRHLFAVEYLRQGGNLYRLSKHLGHTSVKTTESVYLTFLTPEEADKARE